ncbi:hypothetical protein [Aestuariivirga sp.]|uniref:hypothetical protein n=1 Tax=Aestuariivirga sp. TaxID=2650926 RepID=UPI0030176EA3
MKEIVLRGERLGTVVQNFEGEQSKRYMTRLLCEKVCQEHAHSHGGTVLDALKAAEVQGNHRASDEGQRLRRRLLRPVSRHGPQASNPRHAGADRWAAASAQGGGDIRQCSTAVTGSAARGLSRFILRYQSTIITGAMTVETGAGGRGAADLLSAR